MHFPTRCRHFEFSEILTATQNFSESLVIGSGGFGKVYKGNLIYGSSLVVVAIKRLDSMSNQGAAEFWTEVEMLSKLRHCNLVSLIGYCNYEKEMILVHKYIPNGTLDEHLHKLRTHLSWLQRLNICIGAGRGLQYLHTGTGIQSGFIHRDVKSSNILLDETWAAKISDFWWSKVGPINQPVTYVNTLVRGTFGYFDPNYITTGRLTKKSDVYAFGVVLLEVLCRKRAVDTSLDEEEWGLVTWAQDSIKKGNLKRIIDSDISGEISPKCLKEFVGIAERCLRNSPKQRPTMAEVVFRLESVRIVQEKIQPADRTLFGRMVDLLPFTSKGKKSVQGDSKLSSNSNGKDGIIIGAITEVPAHFQSPNPSGKVFKFSDLKKATRNFCLNLLLGEEGFGKVFLGWVEQNTLAPSKQGVGIAVAVKRLKPESSQAQWLAEVNFVGHLDHPNIIRLLGYCRHKSECLLVYEYMPNRTFDRFMFTDIAERLSWGTRLLIMIGVARGLTNLHSMNLIHSRGLKSSGILLDENFNAKLGDFGLLKYGPETGETHVTTWIACTYGYIGPEYFLTGRLTTKSDIYGFGIVLLESITGRRVTDWRRREGQERLVDLSRSVQSNRRNVKEIMDPRLEHKYPLQGAFECVALVVRCVEDIPKDRPSSEEVLQSLEQINALYK